LLVCSALCGWVGEFGLQRGAVARVPASVGVVGLEPHQTNDTVISSTFFPTTSPPLFRAYLSTVPHHDGCTGISLDENNLMSPRDVPTYQKAGRRCGQQNPAMSDFHYHTAPHFAPPFSSIQSISFPFWPPLISESNVLRPMWEHGLGFLPRF
jgi:hypothetical protein